MSPFRNYFFQAIVLILFGNYEIVSGQNISCYQCRKNTNTECDKSELLPCDSKHDRCVVSMKQDENGFELKRECGLGPCTFNDAMLDEGLKWNDCDRSKKNFFCFTCCKGNGCNKSGSDRKRATAVLALIMTIMLLFVVNNYQPPYLPID